MPKTLQALIQASGYAGVAGQSFRYNVQGAGDGSSALSYNLEMWEQWASPNYIENGQYANGAYLDFTFNILAGGSFYHLRNLNVPTPANLLTHVTGGVDIALQEIGTDAQVNPVVDALNSMWDGPPSNVQNVANKVRVQLIGATNRYGQTVDSIAFNWYNGFQQYEIPPDGASPDGYDHSPFTWSIIPTIENAPTSPTYGYVEFTLRYPQDAGAFNPELVSPLFKVNVAKRNVAVGLEFHWSSNSGFTDTVSTYPQLDFTTQSDALGGPNNGYVYMRYRQTGSTQWTNYGAGATPTGEIYWEDARYHSWPPYNTPN